MEKYYNANEISKEFLKEKVKNLGINPDIQNNPAFQQFLNEILPNVIQNNRQILMNEQDEKIILSWTQIDNEGHDNKNSFAIQKDNEKEIIISSFKEGTPRKPGESIHFGKEADQYRIISNGKNIAIAHSSAAINPSLDNPRQCDCYYTAGIVNYDEYGIIFSRQNQSGEVKINSSFDNCNYNAMLFNANKVITSNFNDTLIPYTSKTSQKRINIDTAWTTFEDRRNNQKYEACLPIENGQGRSLKDMEIGYGGLPDSVSILPKGKEEIEKMIQKENDPIVQKGLQNWIKDREHYTYYSNECWSNISKNYSK